jgi:hypothetical protein
VNGQARDSRRVELGNGTPIGRNEREEFERQRNRLLALLHPGQAIALDQ